MSDRFISSVHIQKLGHKIQEIRERALFSIISKLERGFVYDNDLARSKEILSRLFEWFLFDSCSQQDVVLQLIQRILRSDSGVILINHYGAKALTAEIRQIRSNVDPIHYSAVDQLLLLLQEPKEVHEPKEVYVDVPPLQSDLPLSYRSHDVDQPSTFGYTIGSTATPIEGFIQHDCSIEQQTGLWEKTPRSADSTKSLKGEGYFPNFTFKWQHLIAPDRHVLESVEQSLRNPTEPSALLHSCEFFIDVMLQDFPAEVFLQRPAIILLFYDYLKSSKSTRFTNYLLNCLLKLTKCVITRIYYYRDPFTWSSKQSITTQTASETSTPVSPTSLPNAERMYIQNMKSQSSSYTTEDEDAVLLKTKQLSVPHYCLSCMLCVFDYIYVKPESLKEDKAKNKRSQISINLSLVLIDELICLLSLCVKPNAWDRSTAPPVYDVLHKFEEVLVKFADVLEHYRLEVMSNNFNQADRVAHLRLLCSCSNLLVNLIPLSNADFVLPRSLKNALASILLDSALARLYPNVHETIFQFVKEFGGRFETDSIAKYKEVNLICESFTAAINFLRNVKSLPALTALELAKEGVRSLEFHKNLKFVDLVVSLCANKLPQNENVFEIAEEVVLTLLAHSNSQISEDMYRVCCERVIAVIGTTLNTSRTGAPGSQILFLLRPSILVEISLYGVTNDNKKIQKYAQDILIHILKCKILVSESIWNQTVQALIPAFSILTCFAGKSTALGRTVISMLDPDGAKSSNFPALEVIKGNLRLLFVDDALSREEAVSRLCWLMGSQDNSRNLLPRLNSLQDKALGTICQLNRVTDINKVRPSQHFYQPSSLYQVLELLNSEGVEPVIRRSALTQISVMLEDSLLHHTFLERNGINTVVNVMRNALTENNYKDYVDCIIPAVSILKCICLYNSTVRHELCNNSDIYFYILRGLFIFCSEDRMRQDCSSLLCLLLFNDYVLGSPTKADLSLPHLVKERLILPFSCKVHWHTSRHSLPSLAATLLSDKWCLSSIQIHWNSEWFGGFREILAWDEVTYSETHLSQFSEQLCLTNNDLLALKMSSSDWCISKCLKDVQNSTSHFAVLDAIGKLEAYVKLYLGTREESESSGIKDLLSYPWEYSLTRFLTAPPANEEDMLLLIAVLKFVALLVPLYTVHDEPCWIIPILKNPCHCLPSLLQVTLPELELKTVHQELLNLITVCVLHEQQYLDLHMPRADVLPTATWLHTIEIIAEDLKFSDTQHFYNLAYLDSLLSCLVHLTTALGWSGHKAGSIPKEPIPGLILGLCELVGAFHCGKGTSAAASLMGLSITRHVLLVLNHLLAEMQYFNVKGWEMCFLGETAVEENVLYTLCALWLSRDTVLRAAILQLLAGLAMSPRAAIELVQEIKDTKTSNGIWETALAILLDHEEASIVRENAASLLGNIASHTMCSPTNNVIMIANLTPMSMKKNNNVVGAILNLLEDYKFYKELEVILSCLYIQTAVNYDGGQVKSASDDNQSSVQLSNRGEYAYTYTKNTLPDSAVQSVNTKTSNSDSVNYIMVVTPGLVKAVAVFVHNLLVLAEEEVNIALQEYGLIKMFFRAISRPPLKIKNAKDLSLYCEILQMNTAVCVLLNKAVCNNRMCLGAVLHTRDCLNMMLSQLNPSLYHMDLPQLVYLRNRLWTEIFCLIGTLLDSGLQKNVKELACSNVRAREDLTIVSSVLNECGYQPFIQTVCEAISASCSADLQQSALTSLTSLLRAENKTLISSAAIQPISPNSPLIQDLLDNLKTPRTPSVDENLYENLENIEPVLEDKSVKVLWERKPHKNSTKPPNILENNYFEKINHRLSELNKRKKQSKKICDGKSESYKDTQLEVEENEHLMAGAELCRILLHLYDISTIKCKDSKHIRKKAIIVNTLTSILCVSREAKKLALQNGLMEMVIQQLKELHLKLSLESVECLRRIIDKKRLSPVLKELGSLIGLITNFMLGSEDVKCAASVLGLADVIHKLWVWFCVERSLQKDVLKMFCTFTTNCYNACQSLPLTSPVAGSGPRKASSNLSLLHEIVSVISREMEQISRIHDLTILELAFHVLHNSCVACECRTVLVKTNLLQYLARLHPALTKKQKPWESVELIWLEFLLNFTSYPEGQICLAKATEALELVMMFTSSTKLANKKAAMLILRNIAFYQPNRPRLLNSDDFLNILQTKLTSGYIEEINIVATIMWALSANSQKAKLILKCAGLDNRLQECLKCASLSADSSISPEIINLMHRVLNSLKDNEKGK